MHEQAMAVSRQILVGCEILDSPIHFRHRLSKNWCLGIQSENCRSLSTVCRLLFAEERSFWSG